MPLPLAAIAGKIAADQLIRKGRWKDVAVAAGGFFILMLMMFTMMIGGGVSDQEQQDEETACIPADSYEDVEAAPAAASNSSTGNIKDAGVPGGSGGSFALPVPPAGAPHKDYKGKASVVPIPAAMKAIYVTQGKRYGIPWQLLAGIGRVETVHGKNTNTSTAGAQGPMQHIPEYWDTFGQDGDGDGKKDIRNAADSVAAAAYRMSLHGARESPEGVRSAVFQYNRAAVYVNDVLSFAAAYGSGQVTSVVNGAGNAAGCAPATTSGMNCPATGSAAEKNLKPNALRVLRCAAQHFPEYKQYAGVGDRPANSKSDHPNGLAVDVMTLDASGSYSSQSARDQGWKLAHWLEKNAQALGIKYLIYYAKIWESSGGGWKPYTHPSGADDDTSLHLDHVHASVNTGDVGAAGPAAVAVSGKFTNPLRAKYRKSSGYGMREHPNTGKWTMHDGLDMALGEGIPIYSACDGTVKQTVSGWGTGGNMTRVECGGGIAMRYLHQSRFGTSPGAKVKAGQVIGYVGHTGRGTGDHLHFTVLVNNQTVEPIAWMRKQGVTL